LGRGSKERVAPVGPVVHSVRPWDPVRGVAFGRPKKSKLQIFEKVKVYNRGKTALVRLGHGWTQVMQHATRVESKKKKFKKLLEQFAKSDVPSVANLAKQSPCCPQRILCECMGMLRGA